MSMGGKQKVVLDCAKLGELGRSRTKQAMKDETDINRIVDRFARTGLVTHLAKGSPQYLDVAEVGDYRTAIQRVRDTEVFFEGLPAKIRSGFGNDPAMFLDFMCDPNNEAAAREMGLIPKVEGTEPPIDRSTVDEVPGPGVQHRGADGRFESPK